MNDKLVTDSTFPWTLKKVRSNFQQAEIRDG